MHASAAKAFYMVRPHHELQHDPSSGRVGREDGLCSWLPHPILDLPRPSLTKPPSSQTSFPTLFQSLLLHASSHVHSSDILLLLLLRGSLATMTRFISLFLLLCSLQKGFAAKQCYYPNGEESPDHPCDEDAEVSACCGGSFGSICMSNKLCAGGDGGIVRGSCTDKNWASPECPLYCLGADTGGTDLVGCSNVTNTDTSYCCDHNANCCDNGVGRFNVYPSKPKPWATWNRQATEYLVVGTMYTGDAASSTAEATTTATSESSSAATTSEAVTSSTGEAQASEPTEAPAPGLSTGAQAGIGVGVGVGALVVAAVIYLFWKMRKNEKAAKEAKHSPPDYGAPQMESAWHQTHYLPKEPQELHGHQFQGYGVRAELPAQN